MPRGFTVSLAKRLDEMSAVHVKEAEDGEILKKGTIYIAQGGRHLLAAKDGNNLKIVIQDSPPVDALKPCANLMYDSLKNIPVDEITCVVLTGMGADGTRGITSLARYKKVHVIAQNEETCVVYGMPRAIYEAGIVDEVCPLEAVADAITNNVGVS
jgi:two-component system chemotaxis response regulator CheB